MSIASKSVHKIQKNVFQYKIEKQEAKEIDI